MKTIRVIAILSVVAGAACVSSVEQRNAAASDSMGQVERASIVALHAAIPGSQVGGDVFEYSTALPVPAPEKLADAGERDGQVFEYN